MKVAIIIVNWNTGPLLARCLRSLHELPAAERALLSAVWVVDNASNDTSVAEARASALQASSPLPLRFITNPTNVGFARANNQALAELHKAEPTHVLLLNPDTEVRPGAVAALLDVLGKKSDVGIVGPRLVNPDGSTQGSVRPFPAFSDFVLYMLKLGRLIQSAQENAHDYSQPGYVDQVMGAAFLIRDTVIADVGQLDDGFFTLFEEVDYALRARQHGWRSYYTPDATVMHVKAASFNQLIGWRRSLPWLKSSLRYAQKHLAPWQVVLLYIMVPVSLALMIPASLKHVVVKYVH